ncbi:MAG: FAD-dependent oxidoreductase [Bdellovibrionaceae bacterium]|nr:FAD-dependent oxidoreductase [Pseudobdellovibrionaceae bacterium]
MNQKSESKKVAVIGAGPSGTCVAKLLRDQGLQVSVFERSKFPRFSIGESLLPQCCSDLKEAGLLDQLDLDEFQFKNGASFLRNSERIDFDFSEKYSSGMDHAYQVKRAKFDKALADLVEESGVEIRYEQQINDVKIENSIVELTCVSLPDGKSYSEKFDYLVDASGFARVLPRLFSLEHPSDQEPRFSVFTHLIDNNKTKMDRNKIQVVINEKRKDIWYWLIPFQDGSISVGVVGPLKDYDENYSEKENFYRFLEDSQDVKTAIQFKDWENTGFKKILAYSSNVKKLYGENYVLLGNAGEFIDPVFSSGVTIACRSASIAAPLIARQLRGKKVDWEKEFSVELRRGIDVFKEFVSHWYTGVLADIFYANSSNPDIKKMICSILAGYAWDIDNPLTKNTRRRLRALADWVKIDKQEPLSESHT